MKKLISLLCTVFIVTSMLSSCGNNPPKETVDTTVSETASTEAVTNSAPKETDLEIPDSAVEMAAVMKLGWNLGNTLDAIGGEGLISIAPWPDYDEAKTVEDTIEIGVQVNGKVKGTVTIPRDCEKEAALAAAKAEPKIARAIGDATIRKEIYVPNRIINIIAK